MPTGEEGPSYKECAKQHLMQICNRTLDQPASRAFLQPSSALPPLQADASFKPPSQILEAPRTCSVFRYTLPQRPHPRTSSTILHEQTQLVTMQNFCYLRKFTRITLPQLFGRITCSSSSRSPFCRASQAVVKETSNQLKNGKELYRYVP